MAEELPALENLIALLHDGEKGFHELAEHIQNTECRAFLQQESYVRACYAAELARMVHTLTGIALHPSGTRLATVHRGWIDLKARLGAGDVALLEVTALCENFAVRAYRDVLKDSATPTPMHALLTEQLQHVQRSQGIVHEFRGLTLP